MELCLIQVLREVILLSLSLGVVKSFQVCLSVAFVCPCIFCFIDGIEIECNAINLNVAGWDQGLLGACVGEKRKLKIPSKLGYGDNGSPPKIPGSLSYLPSFCINDEARREHMITK